MMIDGDAENACSLSIYKCFLPNSQSPYRYTSGIRWKGSSHLRSMYLNTTTGLDTV